MSGTHVSRKSLIERFLSMFYHRYRHYGNLSIRSESDPPVTSSLFLPHKFQ